MRHKIFAPALLVFIFSGLIPANLIVAASTDSVFSDVYSNSNYVQAIQYLKDNKIIEGYADGSFAPEKTINRAEFTKILIGSVNNAPNGKNCFPDVNSQWFAKYVCTAKTLGVIDGYSDGLFKPEQEVNFSEAAKVIANTFKLNKGQKDNTLWFREYIEALQQDKAIPLSVEYFDEKITRDEMSEIIWRIKADINNQSSRTYNELMGDGLVTVDSCLDLNARYKSLEPPYSKYYDDYAPVMMDGDLSVSGSSSETFSSPKMAMPTSVSREEKDYSNASSDYSTTNLQVQGVDEADIIKNDGKFIYIIKNNSIRIVNAFPASNLKELITFELGPVEESFYPTEMYVEGNQLTVIGTASKNYDYPTPLTTSGKIASPIWQGYSSRTKVYIVDITDRSQPKVTRTVDFDGNYSTSRKTNGTLYLVLNQYPERPYYEPPIYYRDAVSNSLIPTPNTGSDGYNISDYLPKMSDSRDGRNVEIANCSEIRMMPRPKSFNFLITAAIPLNNSTQPVSRNVIVGSGDNVYASTNSLYVASTDWSGPYYYSSESNTKLYRYSLDAGKITYQAQGKVAGTILNQFSMDEFNGAFRIATTQDNTRVGNQESTNNLYILDLNLAPLGQLENIANGEKIYSTRFMGERAYMVTFKSIDPLFVFDLKDNKNPKILGQLKIPGYSDYLHPYDATHLIGFGKDVDPYEAEKDQDFIYYTAVKGFKMGFFDVTDPTHPKEMFKEIIGDQGTYSDLLTNHKALLFNKEKNLISFPITVTEMPKPAAICTDFNYSTCPSSCEKVCQPTCTYANGVRICQTNCDGANSCIDNTYQYPKNVFVGAYVYGVDLQKGFQLKGKITHLDKAGIADLLTNGYADYEKTIQRILYIGDSIYTVSQAAVKANSLSTDLMEQGFIQLAGNLYNLTYGKSVMPVN